jgi:hypothetical protein
MELGTRFSLKFILELWDCAVNGETRRLDKCLWTRSLRFNPDWLHVRFVTDERVLTRVLPELFSFPPPITIPPLLHACLSPPHEVCDSSGQAEHYHTLGAKLGASLLTQNLADLTVKVELVYLWLTSRRQQYIRSYYRMIIDCLLRCSAFSLVKKATAPRKRRSISTRLHIATSQKTVILTSVAMRT